MKSGSFAPAFADWQYNCYDNTEVDHHDCIAVRCGPLRSGNNNL